MIYQQQCIAGYKDTGDNVSTGEQLIAGKQLIAGANETKLKITPRIFIRIKVAPIGYSGAKGKLIHEKT
jgi:hypothetical protein